MKSERITACRKLYLLLVLALPGLLLATPARADSTPAPGDLVWAKRAGGLGDDRGTAVAVLADGSAWVTGDFISTAIFGAGEDNQTSLTRVGRYDIYLARYNPNGTLAWAKSAGGSGSDSGTSMAVLADGNAWVTGYFDGSATFGAGESGESTLTSAGGYDLFLAKYHPDGTLAWARRAGSSSSDYCNSVAVLADGSAWVTGSFVGSATFGAGESGQTTLISETNEIPLPDIFLAKYNPDGTLAWAKRAGSRGTDRGSTVAVLADGSAWVTGYFGGSATFGAGESGESTLTSAGDYDLFLAKYHPDGTLAWVRSDGGSGDESGKSVAVLADGSAWVTGSFGDIFNDGASAVFGAGESGQTTLTSAGDIEFYLAKYHPDGTLAWAKRAGGSSSESGVSVAVLADGSAWVTGEFGGSATFGTGESGQTTLTSAGYTDIFLAKYHSDGSLAWARRAGGSQLDWGTSVAVLADGSAWVTGRFSSSATFGQNESGQTTLNGAGGWDLFLSRFYDTPPRNAVTDWTAFH